MVKVGAPPRAGAVQIEPAFHAYGGGRGMARVRLDLKAPAGRDAFLRLAARADAVLESFRPGVADRLGVGYDDVKSVNPGIVYCSTSGYGQTGPRSQWAGHDLDYLAVGGYLHCSGRDAAGAPALPGATVADIAAGGMQAAVAVLAALLARHRTGEGSYLDVAVADGVLWMLSLAVDEHLATGADVTPGSGILHRARRLLRRVRGRRREARRRRRHRAGVLGEPVPSDRPRASGSTTSSTTPPRTAIRSDLVAAFASRSRDEWVAVLAGADTCVAPVLAIDEVVDDAQFAARHAFTDASHPEHGRFRQVGAVLAGSAPVHEPVELASAGTTDTAARLAAAGMDAAEIAALERDGVIA